MKAGDYVRTNKGIIGKIKAIDNQTELEDLYLVKRRWYYKDNFIKSSPKIIDLIEVGDYVNGCYVDEVFEYEDDTKGITICDASHSVIFNDKKIKSIVTKEQFESMEYKVGE